MLAATLGLTLGLALLSLGRFGWAPRWWVALPLLIALAVIAVLDLWTRTIPDLVTLPSLAYALAVSAASDITLGFTDAALGVIVGGGVVLLIAVASRGGIGGGDIKLTGMLGAAVGWKGALLALALSQLAGGVIVCALLLTRRPRPRSLPVGSIIALLGALILIGQP